MYSIYMYILLPIQPITLKLEGFTIDIICNFQGIDASPLKEDNMFEWTAKILGLNGSMWEGNNL